jgi:hypothetical protein
MQCHIRITDIVRRHMLNILTSDSKSGDRLSHVGIKLSQAFTFLHMHLALRRHSFCFIQFVGRSRFDQFKSRGLINFGSMRGGKDSDNFIG